jgi:hypothetical protein
MLHGLDEYGKITTAWTWQSSFRRSGGTELEELTRVLVGIPIVGYIIVVEDGSGPNYRDIFARVAKFQRNLQGNFSGIEALLSSWTPRCSSKALKARSVTARILLILSRRCGH